MMYVKNEAEIREWILDGIPNRLSHENGGRVHDGPALPIRMPAFRGRVTDDEVSELVAYYKAVAVFDSIPEDARRGYRLAADHGCFGCHGPGGLLGARNPGSFKGYIPPWRGRDFADVVRNDDELRAWIQDGAIRRFASNPLARYFTTRQLTHMPAFHDVITASELDDLVTYIHWLGGENHEQDKSGR